MSGTPLRRLSLTFLFAAACGRAPDVGTAPAPQESLDPWVADVYRPVQELACELDVDGFMGLYPEPDYLRELSYAPADATYLPEIASFAGMTAEHDAVLARQGFVAVAGTHVQSFVTGYSDIYDNDLPVLITADSMLYALHHSFDAVLRDFEVQLLIPAVERMLLEMHRQLVADHAALPAALRPAARDLDIYLSVARTLATGGRIEPIEPADREVVAAILAASDALRPGEVELFGVASTHDFSQMRPRGHYDGDPALERYFRTMVWLGRAEMPMITHDDARRPSFNRRGLEAAMLSELLLQASGAAASWSRVDRALELLVGERDSMNSTDVRRYMEATGVRTAEALAQASDEQLAKALLGGGYGLQRIMSQILFTDPDAPPAALPRVYHLLGQRFTIDSHVLNNVSYDRLKHPKTGEKTLRMLPSELDVLFALGGDAAARHLRPELERWGYQGMLHELRFLIDAHPASFWDASFYNGWLAAIRALNDPAEFDRRPEPMRTAAWADKTLNTQAASWAELRHDTLLYVKQSYSGSVMCEYPDAYVEPVPAFYARLGQLGRLGSLLVDDLDDAGSLRPASEYFAELTAVAGTLEGIAHKELEGAPLDEPEWNFLRGAIEKEIIGCGEVHYDGWYGRLFYDRSKISDGAPTIADIHTAPTDEHGAMTGHVLHAGTGQPMLMVLTVPDCSGPRAYVGPISSYYSLLTEDFARKTDEEWAGMLMEQRPPRPRWTGSFVR
jgi:hypothetical protein